MNRESLSDGRKLIDIMSVSGVRKARQPCRGSGARERGTRAVQVESKRPSPRCNEAVPPAGAHPLTVFRYSSQRIYHRHAEANFSHKFPLFPLRLGFISAHRMSKSISVGTDGTKKKIPVNPVVVPKSDNVI